MAMPRFTLATLGRCGLALGLACGVVHAQGIAGGGPNKSPLHTEPAPAADGQLDFDIPAQALEDALLKYGEITRQPALYPSEQMTRLRSHPVQGRYTPEAALGRLLEGTGLVSEKISRPHGDVFRLKPMARPAPPTPPRASGPDIPGADLDGFPASLQAGVLKVLCADPQAAPGGYRAILQVAVDAGGAATATTLLDTTGNPKRDAAILAAVRRLRTGPPPAASVQVPYLIALVPAAAPCAAYAKGPP